MQKNGRVENESWLERKYRRKVDAKLRKHREHIGDSEKRLDRIPRSIKALPKIIEELKRPEVRRCEHCQLYRVRPFFRSGICEVDLQRKNPEMTCDKEYIALWDKDNRKATYFRPRRPRI